MDGTLLVTPNAVMYDPNVSNPTVIETGAEAFTFVAKMDMIVSLAIYRSIEDMYCMHRHRSVPTGYTHQSEVLCVLRGHANLVGKNEEWQSIDHRSEFDCGRAVFMVWGFRQPLTLNW